MRGAAGNGGPYRDNRLFLNKRFLTPLFVLCLSDTFVCSFVCSVESLGYEGSGDEIRGFDLGRKGGEKGEKRGHSTFL